jgi:hypothetical protein
VNDAGQVFFDGDLMAEPDDQDCSSLVDRLRHQAGFGGHLSFGLSIDHNLPAQRFIDIMNAMARAGMKEPPVIFEEF